MSEPKEGAPGRRDLRIPANRQYFSTTLPYVLRMLELLNVPREDHATLLGLSPRALQLHLKGVTLDLNEEQITRMSLLGGIYKCLYMIFPPSTAAAWFTRHDDAPPLLGQTPLAYALREGIPGLYAMRRTLEGDALGNFNTTIEDRRRASKIRQPPFTLHIP